MAKRRTFNRSSKRFSKNRSNDSIGSRLLDPDPSIMAEEQARSSRRNNLNETMSSSHSLIHNSRNEVPQLNINSQLESNPNTSQWWKHLESPNSGSNTSTRSRTNLSKAIVTTNVLQTSTSDSEMEFSLRKRKVRLRVASRKSDSNAFLDALNNTEADIPLKARMKQAKYSNVHETSDREVSKRKLDENKEHDSNFSLSPSPNILKLKPSIFKRRKSGGTRDQNPFQDIVTEGDSSDFYFPVRKKSVTFEKESSKRSMHQNINTDKDHTDDQRKSVQLLQTLPLENNEAGLSNLSTCKVVLKNNVASDINKIVETSDESDISISNRKRFKFKSHLMQRARRSMGNNPFKDALVENRDITLPKHNQDKKIDIHDAKSPLETKSLSTPSKKIVNRFKRKTDVAHENVLASSPIRRSPRSLETAKKHSLNISTQDSIEQSISNSSLDSNKFHTKRHANLKLTSKISPLHKKSLTNNPFKEILIEDGNINARNSNIAVSSEDNRISVEQDKITTEISQVHEQMEKYSQSMRSSSEDSDTSEILLSNNVGNVSEKLNVQPKRKNKLSGSNDVVNVSKSISDIRGARSSLETKSLSTPSKKIVNRFKRKTDVTHENVLASSPIRRSPRSLIMAKKHSLDISAQVQDNIEQSTSNSSLDSNEFHIKRPANLKLKSKISPLHERSLTNNPFKKILMEDGNIDARRSNIAVPTEDNRISVEQDKSTTEISQEHEQVEKYSRLTRSLSEDSDMPLKISSSNNAENVSENFNVQSKEKNKLSESNDVVNVSKSISQRNIIIKDKSKVSPNKKQISFSRKSTRDISEFFKEHTNAISPADRTNINEMETRNVTSDGKSFIAKDAPSTSNVRNFLKLSKVVNAESFEKIKAEIDRLKIRERAAMRMAAEKKESALKAKNVKLPGATRKQPTKKNNPPKVVDPAYLVNGKVYKPPRLPRPKHWATDHLYKFLWKRMEPKYQFSTRVRSEKFMLLLAKIVSIIERRKKYENYKLELEALMKEMARLNIINTRNDFHHFCQDFMPHEFCIKVVPMLLPGNIQNIPFEIEKLHIPLLEET